MRRRVAAAAGAAGLGLVLVGGPAAALESPAAVSQPNGAVVTGARAASSGWTPGYCTSASGATVVADFTDLGSGIVVRCVPGKLQTGVAALQQAGLAPQGTAQYGLAFICRIAGRPGVDEPLDVDGHPGYTEQCAQTPPESAHWEYWTAPNGGPWTFSTTGATTHQPIQGGFEGWSFSLNGSHHSPGINPTRPSPSPSPKPTPSPPAPTPTPSPAPTSHLPAPKPSQSAGSRAQPVPTSAASQASPSATPPASSGGGAHRPTTTRSAGSGAGPGSAHNHRAGGAHKPDRKQRHREPRRSEQTATAVPASPSMSVSGEIPKHSAAQTAGSPTATLAGLGVLALLAAGAGVTAWRRTRRV